MRHARGVAELLGLGGLTVVLLLATVQIVADPPPAPTAAAAGPTAAPPPVIVPTAPPTMAPAALPPTATRAAPPTPAPSPTAHPLAVGRTLFQQKACIGCHSVSSAGLVTRASIGPDLAGLSARAATRRPDLDAAAYVRQSVREPWAYRVPEYVNSDMPVIPVTDAELDALVAFLLAAP